MAPREVGIEHGNRLPERRGLRQTNGPGYDIPADLGPKVLPHLVGHLVRQLCSGVVHGQHDGRDVKALVQIRRNQMNVAKQLTETLEGVVLALDRHQHLGRRRQTVYRDQPERRWTVDQHVVEIIDDGLNGPASI